MEVSRLGRCADTGMLQLWFHCPGRKSPHRVSVNRDRKTAGAWKWNGSTSRPTLSPSVNHPGICHFKLKDGIIDFCDDSKHDLAGQKVPLEEFTGW